MSKYSNRTKYLNYIQEESARESSNFKECLNLSISREDLSGAMKFLKQKGNFISAILDKNFLPLHLSVKLKSQEIVKKLVESISSLGETYKHVLDIQDTHGDTPLQATAFCCNIAAANFLLKHGAANNIINKEGNDTLHMAIISKNLDFVKILVRGGVALNILNNEGDAPIHTGILHNFPEAIEYLIKRGANVNLKNSEGDPPLNIAIVVGNEEIIECLVKHGANIDDSSSEGDTPLHLAVKENPNIVPYLVSCHAKLDTINAKGRTPIDSAREEMNEVIASFLERSSAVDLLANCIDSTGDNSQL